MERALRIGLDELRVDLQVDLVSNQNAASFECSVPGQAELLAAELCGCFATGAGSAHWVVDNASEVNVERQRLRGAAERELTLNGQVAAFAGDLGGDEVGFRVGLRVKEIRRTQVLVAASAS